MNTSYIVLGGVLVLMGSVQMWLRYGSWGKEQQEAELALAKRRAAANEADAEDADADGESRESGAVFVDRGSKLWNKWTAILGPLGIALGLFLVLWGIFKV
jgi:hypothetical protein